MLVALGVLWREQICYLVHALPGVDPADAIGAHRAYPAAESVIGRCLTGGAGFTAFRRPEGEFTAAASIGEPAVAAVSLTGSCDPAGETAIVDRVREMGAAIERALRG